MSPEIKAIEMMNKELDGVDYPNLRADIIQFLARAQKELTPEEHEEFRESLSKIVAEEKNACFVALSLGKLFGSNTGLKVEFNKFVGSEWKLGFISDTQRQEAAALGANVGEEPAEQSHAESVPSGSAAIYTDSSNGLSSLSADEMPESGAAPTSFAGIIPDKSPE